MCPYLLSSSIRDIIRIITGIGRTTRKLKVDADIEWKSWTDYDVVSGWNQGSYIPGNESFLYTHANALKAGRLVVP